MQALVAGWVRDQGDLQRDMVKRVRERRERVRELSSHGYLPVFEVPGRLCLSGSRGLGTNVEPTLFC